MRAVTWQGRRKVTVETVPDPIIKEPTDAIIRVTSTNICGSDLHLYQVLGAFMTPGDGFGHEAMGVVADVGREARNLAAGDRVVIPFNISCGHCFMCSMACRIATQRGDCRVIGVDLVPERLQRARATCSDVIDLNLDHAVEIVLDQNRLPGRRFGDRRGGNGSARLAGRRGGPHSCQDAAFSGRPGRHAPRRRRRMGQANVKKWAPDILPLLSDDDPLGTESFATHRLPLNAAPDAYEQFQKKQDGMIKVVLTP
jgi:threonine dehydrogenase-like Zn-dependent dehydrogenase